MMETVFGICDKDILCRDCDERCVHAGEASADCPRIDCCAEAGRDCEDCEWLRQYLKETGNGEKLDWVKEEAVMEDPIYMKRKQFTRKYGDNSQETNQLLENLRP